MMPAMLLALAAAATAETPSAGVLLKATAATAPACRTTPVDGQLVRAALFARDSEQCPVARVGDETIALRELAEALESGHLSRKPRAAAPAKRPDMDFTPALDRLIELRLIVQEGREMQLDRDPAFRANVEEHKASKLRTMLQEIAARSVKPDPKEVEKLYRDAVRQFELSSVLVEKEDDAKAFRAALDKGEKLDALAKRFVEQKRARGGGKPEVTSPKHMLPEVLAAVQGAKQGVPVGPLKVPSGWAFFRVDGFKYPNDPAARAQAEARSRSRVEHDTLRKFYLSLKGRYAKVDEPLLKSLDFEAKGEEGFKALLADQRPVATIAGEKPITVGDLTREVSKKFFHGIKSPIEQHRVNPGKDEEFEKLLGARLFAREAAARKLAARPEYRREVAEYERGLVFGAFIEKVIVPDVKVSEQEAAAYYEKHKAEYTAPEMYKLDGIAFATSKEAQTALEKLKGGTDFAWMRSSAPNQLTPAQRTLQFDGRTLSAGALPRELADAVASSRSGDYRLYSPRQGEVYVIRVEEQVPPSTQPYVQAREEIAKKLFNEKVTQGIHDYAAKLRKAQRVDVLITRVSL